MELVAAVFYLLVCLFCPPLIVQSFILWRNEWPKTGNLQLLILLVAVSALSCLLDMEHAGIRAQVLLVLVAVRSAIVFVMCRLGLQARMGPPSG